MNYMLACAARVKVLDGNSFVANINFQQTFGAIAIAIIIIGLIIACIAFVGWCSNCCGGYNIFRVLVSKQNLNRTM